jgi:hypothetical protein
MIAAIVVPAGFLSIAMMRACLVSGPAADLEGAGTDRLRDAVFLAFRTFERFAAFGFDLGLVMESSEVCATSSAALPQPRPANSQPAGQDPEAGCSRPSHHSNALFGLECQSILSKIVTRKAGRRSVWDNPQARWSGCVRDQRLKTESQNQKEGIGDDQSH